MAQLHAMAAPFSMLDSIRFCDAIAAQFLQCCQKLKNYISPQFHVDRFTKRWKKNIGKLISETTLIICEILLTIEILFCQSHILLTYS